MKHSKKILGFAMSAMAVTGLLGSCSVDEFIANKDVIKDLGDFRFSTSNEVVLDIDYGPLASRALVEVYGENPLANATADDQTPKGELVFSAFLDKNGIYCGTVDIPAHVTELYAYSSSWGAPYLVKTDIKGNRATLHSGENNSRSAYALKSRAGDENYIVRPLKPEETGDGNVSNLWTISDGWNEYGKSNDANHLEDEGHLTNQDLVDLQNYIWEGAESKPRTEEHKKFINSLKTDKANIVVVDQYADPVTGETVPVENAEVWFTFVNEYAWNENAMGYYYYPEGTTPNKNNLKMFIIVPNASVSNNNPFGMANSSGFHSNDDAPIKTNHRIQLLYMDDQGNVGKDFPPGTDIGFFTIVNGFHLGSKYGSEKTADGKYTTRTKGGISSAATRYYSNREFNGGTDHYIAVRMKDGTIVYGVEDGSDGSFDDVLFTVTASPNLSIKPESKDVHEMPQEHVVEKFYTDKSKKFTYLFEDQWPNGGDYDLNDVVVRHSREVTYNQYNYVSEVKETFKVESTPTTGDDNAIAFVIPEEHMSSELILPDGAVYEEDTRSVFITTSASNLYGKTVTVIRRGFSGVRKDDILKEFINPYIVNQTGHPAWNEQGRVEIHLANVKRNAVVTSKAFVSGDPIVSAYIDKGGMYPYAIEIPNTTFVPCDPGVAIGSGSGAYPNYNKWVESLGKSYTDWYKTK